MVYLAVQKKWNNMKALDKIYVSILPRIENSIIFEHCVGTAWDNKEHIIIPDIEEYIRKDSLLEWAKEQASFTEKLNGKGAMLKAWDSLIDKIESL